MRVAAGDEKRKDYRAIIENIEHTLQETIAMLRLSLEALQILDAIDRKGTFAAAGTEMHKVPSTISYTVSKLEQELGVQVFERAGPRVKLTRAGAELLKEGRYLLKAAEDLEHRVRRVASGWETELSIAMDSLFSPVALTEEIRQFYQVADSTRLRFAHETLAGTWEALLERRADLIIGAAGEGPSGGGYNSHRLGSLAFVFCVSPEHPLAALRRPLGKADLHRYRNISVSDSVRKGPSRTVGLLFGQDTLAVPDMYSKYLLQLAGIGFGFLPQLLAQPAIDAGRLLICEVEEPRHPEPIYLAWRSGEDGAALKWWLDRMRAPGMLERLAGVTAGQYL